MKRFIALTTICLIPVAFQIVSAGPERYEGKDKMVQPILEQPQCSWTGFYIGINGGYGGGNLTWKDTDFPGESNAEIVAKHNTDSFFGGGTIGYNREFNNWLVVGVEGDFNWSDLGGHNRRTIGGPPANEEEIETKTQDTSNDWMATIALRVGVTSMNNKLLSYVKGGAVIEQWNYDSTNDETLLQSTGFTHDSFHTDETRVGPMVGCGMEYMINCHWTAKAEYNHMFLGTDTINGSATDDGVRQPESFDVEINQDTVKFGLNYKF
jgi:outer membrane immunogenic protein